MLSFGVTPAGASYIQGCLSLLQKTGSISGTKPESVLAPFFKPQDPQYGWVTCLKHRPLQKARARFAGNGDQYPQRFSGMEEGLLAGLRERGWTGKGRTHSI